MLPVGLESPPAPWGRGNPPSLKWRRGWWELTFFHKCLTWHKPPPGTSTLWLPPMLLITNIWNDNHFTFTFRSCVCCCWNCNYFESHRVRTKSFLILVFHICYVWNAYHTSLFVIFSLHPSGARVLKILQRCWYKYKFHYSAAGSGQLHCTEYVSSCRVTKCGNGQTILELY